MWPELLNRKSLRLDRLNISSLLEQVPVNAWPALFEQGYHLEETSNADDLPPDIVTWLLNGSNADITQAWPLLTQHSTVLADRAIAVVLRPFGRVDWANCSFAGRSIDQQTVDKIHTLIQLGAHPHPAPLLAACATHTPPKIVAQLLELNVITAQSTDEHIMKTRFERHPPHCRVPDDAAAWLKALSRSTLSKTPGKPDIGTVQIVDLPDEACALIVTGASTPPEKTVREKFLDAIANGPASDCVPTFATGGEIWSPAKSATPITDTVEAREVDVNALPIRDTVDGQLYYVIYPENQGDCVNTLQPYLMRWTGSAPYALKVVGQLSPTSDALLNQCNFESDINTCIGDAPGLPAVEPSNKRMDSRPFKPFTNEIFAKQRLAYLAAVQAFDLPNLKALTQNGVMPDWTLEALEAVSRSDLPREERRRRTAWLFQDRDQLGAALTCTHCGKADEVILGLGTWLPREDWRPLVQALVAKYSPAQLPVRFEKLADLALDRGDLKLACRFYTEIATTCPTGALTQAMP